MAKAKVLDWHRDIVEGLFWVGLSLFLSWLALPYLPDRVPTRFKVEWFNGCLQPIEWKSKEAVVWVMLADELIGLWVVSTLWFWLAAKEEGQPQLDEGIEWARRLRSWIAATGIAAQGGKLAGWLGWFSFPNPISTLALGLLFLAIGKAMPNLPRNRVVGVLLPWIIGDERVWKLFHRLAGWGFRVAGLCFLITPLFYLVWDGLLVVPWLGLCSVGLCSFILILIGYSYLLYRRLSG